MTTTTGGPKRPSEEATVMVEKRLSGRKLVTGAFASALAVGLVLSLGVGPASSTPMYSSADVIAPQASQAKKSKKVTGITGKVTLKSHNVKTTATRIVPTLWMEDCEPVQNLKRSVSKNTYSITAPKPGTYRVTVSTKPTKHAPWGAKSVKCRDAKKVKVAKGKQTRHNVTVTAFGAVSVSGKGSYTLYEKTGKREAGWEVAGVKVMSTRPGTYKLVRVNSDDEVASVFGTKSKDPAQGKSVKVVAGRVISASFSKGTLKTLKTFPVDTTLRITGKGKVGSTLRARLSKLPKGTRVQYRWDYVCLGADEEYDIFTLPGRKKSSLKITKEHRGLAISAIANFSKPGYLSDGRSTAGRDERLIPGKPLARMCK